MMMMMMMITHVLFSMQRFGCRLEMEQSIALRMMIGVLGHIDC